MPIRYWLWDKQNGRCYYCGVKLKKGRLASDRMRLMNIEHDSCTSTIDHVIPKSQGGIGTPGNVVYACLKCNEERGNEDFLDFSERKRNET